MGEGSEFVVDLYVHEAKDTDIIYEKKNQEDVSLDGLNVLLVEDNDINAMIAITLLEGENCNITLASNGLEAVDIFEKSKIGELDVILMDIRMPIMNGYEATKRIRSNEREDAERIPIIAMTADVYAESAVDARTAGMNAHVLKPFEPKILYQVIKEQVTKSRL